jgi:hypothetical protein
MAEALSRSPDYRILRRLVARPTYIPTAGQEVRTGILLDTETTGLDGAKDEIIELGMVKFDYTPDGRIVGVRDTFSAFNEPTAPISAEVTALTGITNEMVAGRKFDDAAVTAFVDSAVITIAHNSGFDRKFAERYAAAARSVGVRTARTRHVLWIVVAFATGMVGAVVYLQKARISPDAAFSVTDWTAYVIFIVVIGGVRTIEGLMVGVLLLWGLVTYLAQYGSLYLVVLGTLAILIMLFMPAGVWGAAARRWQLQLFPTRRRLGRS